MPNMGRNSSGVTRFKGDGFIVEYLFQFAFEHVKHLGHDLMVVAAQIKSRLQGILHEAQLPVGASGGELDEAMVLTVVVILPFAFANDFFLFHRAHF